MCGMRQTFGVVMVGVGVGVGVVCVCGKPFWCEKLGIVKI